jgi:ATP synthase protein I
MVKNGDEKNYRFVRQVGLLTTIPVMLLSGPLIGFLIGDYIDKRFGTTPWFMIICLILGFVASIRQTINIIRKAGKKD